MRSEWPTFGFGSSLWTPREPLIFDLTFDRKEVCTASDIRREMHTWPKLCAPNRRRPRQKASEPASVLGLSTQSTSFSPALGTLEIPKIVRTANACLTFSFQSLEEAAFKKIFGVWLILFFQTPPPSSWKVFPVHGHFSATTVSPFPPYEDLTSIQDKISSGTAAEANQARKLTFCNAMKATSNVEDLSSFSSLTLFSTFILTRILATPPIVRFQWRNAQHHEHSTSRFHGDRFKMSPFATECPRPSYQSLNMVTRPFYPFSRLHLQCNQSESSRR